MFWLLSALGCGAEGKDLRRDLEAMRRELQMMRQENAELTKRVEVLSGRLEALESRTRPGMESTGTKAVDARADTSPATGAAGVRSPGSAAATESVIPPNLAVVKLGPAQKSLREGWLPRKVPPPLPTAVPIRDPDSRILAGLSTSKRDLGTAAQADLDAARNQTGLAAARALEAFTGHYPHHPNADNALIEAAQLRVDADDRDAACDLYEKCVREYPAGDALPDALERLADCYFRRGQKDRARPLLERVMKDYPQTAVAKRAAERLAEAAAKEAMPVPPSQSGAAP